MSDSTPSSISELLIIANNDKCAECSSLNVEFVSLFYNVFLCRHCKEVHQKFYAPSTNPRSLMRELCDTFSRNELFILKQSGGNDTNRQLYESTLPSYFPRPTPRTVPLLRKEFILGKYERLEFMDRTNISQHNGPNTNSSSTSSTSSINCSTAPSPQSSSSSSIAQSGPLNANSFQYKKGVLLKRLKDGDSYMERTFELSMMENYLRYFKPDSKKPKKTLNLDQLNVTLLDPDVFQVPDSTMLVNIIVGKSTRNLFLSAKDGNTLVSWYLAIRGAKFHRTLLCVTDVTEKIDPARISESVTYDYAMCGWLEKTGPQESDAWRRRWCMLGRRRLAYFVSKHSPYPQGEIVIGNANDGFEVKMGAPANWKKHDGFTFTLVTPYRTFLFQEADSREVRDRWVEAIQRIIQTPMTMEDRKGTVIVLNKHKNSNAKSS